MMPSVIVLIDDRSLGFWEREEQDVWLEHLSRPGVTVEFFRNAGRDIADRVCEATKKYSTFDYVLITDQQLFNGEFDGADLAESLISQRVIQRAVVFSEIARLRPAQRSLPLLAEPRIRSRDAIRGVFSFLDTGRRPSIDDLLEYSARLERALQYFAENTTAISPQSVRQRLLRPAIAYGLWDRDLEDGTYLIDTWLSNVGSDMPSLFSPDSLFMFEDGVKHDAIQYMGGKDSETANRLWLLLIQTLHPWTTLRLAGINDGSGGAFRLLIELGKCGGRSELMPSILSEEQDLSPREKKWISIQRRAVSDQIAEMVNDAGSLHSCLRQSIDELHEVCTNLSKVTARRNELG